MQSRRIERVLNDLERASAAAQEVLQTGSDRATEFGSRLGRGFKCSAKSPCDGDKWHRTRTGSRTRR